MSIRVLVVDDSALMRRYISQILEENLDVEIFTARDGADALAKAQELNPDVITLDINMPEMDGITGGVSPNRRKFRRIVFKRYSPIIPAPI